MKKKYKSYDKKYIKDKYNTNLKYVLYKKYENINVYNVYNKNGYIYNESFRKIFDKDIFGN